MMFQVPTMLVIAVLPFVVMVIDDPAAETDSMSRSEAAPSHQALLGELAPPKAPTDTALYRSPASPALTRFSRSNWLSACSSESS